MSNRPDPLPAGTDPAFEERVREAWESYRIACIDVDAEDYDATELIAWDLLQHELQEAERQRLELETAAALLDRAA